MKKNVLLVAAILTLTSCTTIGNFWDGLFGKEKYQPIPSNKRTPLLNQYSSAPAPQTSGQRPPMLPEAMGGSPYSAMPQIPSPPDPFGEPMQMAQPMMPPSASAPLVNPYGNGGLPSDRRPPEFNKNLMGDGNIPVRSAPVARAPLPSARMPELPEASEYPRLSQMPPQQAAPIPLKNDPRVQELQRKMAEAKSGQPENIIVPPIRPIDSDEPKPISTPRVAKMDMDDNAPFAPPKRSPQAQMKSGVPSTDFRDLRPLPPTEDMIDSADMSASTDYRNLRPVAPSYAPDYNHSANPYGETVPNNVEVLRTARYEKLRSARMNQKRTGIDGYTSELVRHSFLD